MKIRNIALLVLSIVVVGLLAALVVVTTVGAQPAGSTRAPLQVAYPITYQGRLTDNLGNPIANQTVNITFRLYEQPVSGQPVWEQVRAVQTDGAGLFTAVMEVDPPIGISDLSSAYLSIEVENDGEMMPRQRVGGAPFAFTLVPGNGVTGTVDLGGWPSAIFGVVNTGTGHGLLAITQGEGVGVFASSRQGFGGYFRSDEGHALAVDGPVLFQANLRRVALHRWYEVNEAGVTFPTLGSQPKGILFDGGSIWVTNSMSDTVVRRRVSDGKLMGVYPVGDFPVGMTYDGARLWVANRGDNTVTRLVAADGTPIGAPIAVGAQPNGLCFDGRYIWVVNSGDNNVTRLRADTGAAAGTFPVGQSPRICAFDGANIWVTDHDSNTVTVLRASDGSLVRTVNVGTHPVGIIFDGANMWVANSGSNDVAKIRVSDGTVLGTFPVGQGPRGITFDGFHIWVTNYTDSTVTKLRARDGALVGTYGVGAGPRGITFDGSDIWVVNGDADSVARL